MGSDTTHVNPHIVRNGELKRVLMAIRRFFVVAEVDLAPALWLRCRFRTSERAGRKRR